MRQHLYQQLPPEAPQAGGPQRAQVHLSAAHPRRHELKDHEKGR